MPTTVDDFDDLAEYTGDLSGFSVGGSVLSAGTGGNYTIASTSGLNAYPSTGDTYAVEVKSADLGPEAAITECGFGAQSATSMYLMTADFDNGNIRLRDAGVERGGVKEGQPVTLAQTGVSLLEGTWYDLRLSLQTSSQDSNFVFEAASPIAIGASGAHDLLRHQQEPVPSRSDASGFVYEQGDPLGGFEGFVLSIYDSPSSSDALATVAAELSGYSDGGIGFRTGNETEKGARWRNARLLSE